MQTMKETTVELLWLKIHDYAYSGSLGIFAALVGLVYQAAKGTEKITLLIVISTLTSGMYLGITLSSLISDNMENKDALILLIGAGGMKAFEIALRGGKKLLSGFFKDKT